MNKKELIQIVSKKNGIKKDDVKTVIEDVLSAIESEMKNDDGKVVLSGFGTFENKTYKARNSYNPRTNKHTMTGERSYPSFSPSKSLVSRINGGEE